MRLCKDCRHYKALNWCKSPRNGLSVLDGEVLVLFATACRSDNTMCGQSAKHWQAILPVTPVVETKPWWRFW